MVRFVLRRNRDAARWSGSLSWSACSRTSATYYASLFDTQQSLDDFATISNTPGIKALTGLAAAPNTLGGAVWTKIWMTCSVEPGVSVSSSW